MLYGSKEAARRAGISYRQLDYWARTGLVTPVVEARGSGSKRLFSHREVEWLIVVATLRRQGYELAALRRMAAERLTPLAA